MTDEIRIYHVDDPNDAPDRRLGAFPTINPFLPTSLPQYVIEPVANSLYTAMQYYWYSAYQQGIAAQRQHQQQQQQHQHQLTQLHQQQQPFVTSPQAANVASAVAAAASQSNSSSSSAARTMTSLTPIDSAPIDGAQPQKQQQRQQQAAEDQHQLDKQLQEQQLRQRLGQDSTPTHLNSQPPSAASTAPMASSSSYSSSSSSSGASTASCSPSSHHHHHHSHLHNNHHNHHSRNNHLDDLDSRQTERSQSVSSIEQEQAPNARRQEHIKKPLNPFMIFMQQRRPEIVRQGTIKESAAINQLLGQQWRKLSREEQEPYYKMAEQEKKIHALKYPGWSARDNYANQKKRKKLKLKSISLNGLDQSDKKCRARFGLSNMASWCKPCKRKKKCIYSRHPDRSSNNSSNNNNNNSTTITSNNNHQASNNLHHQPQHQQPQLHSHQHPLPMHHHPLQPFHNPMNHAGHGLHSFPF